jgi:hypothetical protein
MSLKPTSQSKVSSESTLWKYTEQVGEKVDDLNKELDYFRTTFNRRVQYFAAYQIVSDSVSLHRPRTSTRLTLR